MSLKKVWMVRAGNENEIIDVVRKKAIIAVGWGKMGNISNLKTRKEVKERYKNKYPGSEKRIATGAGQLFRFAQKMEKGDLALTYDKSSREILIGEIKGDYIWKPKDAPEGYPHVRQVEWKKTVSRDEFSEPARNSLGGISTIFSLNAHIPEIESILKGKKPKEEGEEIEEGPPYIKDVQSRARELIADRISEMEPYDFQYLVAAVLEAMGYKTRVSGPGPDRGIDITAHPDQLGLEEPLIRVQVKRRQGSVNAKEIRRFNGVVSDKEKGLYVSTGGYTGNAERDAEGMARITILDRDGFIDLLLKNYEKIDPEYKALVPLKRVYVHTWE